MSNSAKRFFPITLGIKEGGETDGREILKNVVVTLIMIVLTSNINEVNALLINGHVKIISGKLLIDSTNSHQSLLTSADHLMITSRLNAPLASIQVKEYPSREIPG